MFLFAEGLFIRDETEINVYDSEVPAPKEQSQKAYREILLNELTTGLAEFKRPTLGLARLPHAIVGAGEVLTNVYLGETSIGQFASFLALTTLGNSLGGVFFVAALKYGHSTRGIDGPVEAAM